MNLRALLDRALNRRKQTSYQYWNEIEKESIRNRQRDLDRRVKALERLKDIHMRR